MKLTGIQSFDKKIVMHTSEHNDDVIQSSILLLIMGRKKRSGEKKWTNREYHVKNNENFQHRDVKMYCTTNQFTQLSFCGPTKKPYGAHG